MTPAEFETRVAIWAAQPSAFSDADWPAFIRACSPAPFSPHALQADPALWGTFWQGDVIAPGYTLPALELAFLRATRLEQTFAADSPSQFLDSLQQMLARPPHGLWAARLHAGRAVCAVFFDDDSPPACIWLTAVGITAACRAGFARQPGYNLTALKPCRPMTPPSPPKQSDHRAMPAEWSAEWESLSGPMRQDRLIQFHRLCGYFQHPPADILRYRAVFLPNQPPRSPKQAFNFRRNLHFR